MEILKGFVFDIQLFGTVTVNAEAAPWSADAGVYISTNGSTWYKVGDAADETAAAALTANSVKYRYNAEDKVLELNAADGLVNSGDIDIEVKVVSAWENTAAEEDQLIVDVTTHTQGSGAVEAAGGTIELGATSTVTINSNKITGITNGVTVKEGTVKFEGADGAVTYGEDKTYTLTGTTISITAAGALSGFTEGAITSGEGESITYSGVEYDPSENDGTVTLAALTTGEPTATTVGLQAVSGAGTIDAVSGNTYQLMGDDNGTPTVGDEVAVGENTEVKIAVDDGNAEITGLDTVGETVTINDATVGEVTLEVKQSGETTYVKVTGGPLDGTYYSADAEAKFTDSTTTAEAINPPATPIDTTKYNTENTTIYFNAQGEVIEDPSNAQKAAAAAILEVKKSNKTLTVKESLGAGVTTAGDTSVVTIKDSKTTTEYTLSDYATVTTAGKGDFTVTDGVVSDATVGLVLDDDTTAITAVGNVNIDASAAPTATITYAAGTDVEAKITLSENAYFTLTENNSGENAEDTVINLDAKSITGIDGDATIKPNGLTDEIGTLKTTGSGTFTYDKTSYVVSDDEDGVEFTLSEEDATITGISELDQDATVKIDSKLAEAALTVNGVAFENIAAKKGATFTGTKANKEDATITLFAAGDTVFVDNANDYTYEIESMGGDDGVVIGYNTLAALNEGDKVKVYAGLASDYDEDTDYVEYEVGANNTMVVTVFDGDDDTYETTTYTLSDSDDSGFTVGDAIGAAKINGDAGVATEAVTFGTAVAERDANSLADGVFVHADGSLSTSESKAVAKLSVNDDVVTYASQSSKGQVVDVTKGSENWDITTGAGRDTIGYAGDGDASINGGGGDDEITLAGKGDIVANTGDGKNKVDLQGSGDVTLTLGSGKDTATATAASTGDLVINAVGGNNEIDLSAKTKGDVTVVGGTGNDTITASGTDDVISGGDGNDVFVVGNGITISDYSFDNDVIDASAGFGGVTDEGKVLVGGKAADISATAGEFYTARINTGALGVSNKKPENYAWAKDGGSVIDITTYTKDVNLIGDADGASALYAGSGDDVINGRADGDSVFGGAGKNTINLSSGGEKRVVGISAAVSSKDTVNNFNASFEDEGDSFFLISGNLSDTTVSIDTVVSGAADLTLKNGGATVSLQGADVSDTGAVELKIGASKFAAIESGKTATVESASYADAYIGDGSAVDFSKVDGDLYVDLSNDLAASGNGPKFVGITSVTGGTGTNILMGSTKADSIVAGSGKSSLYGGAGSDTLVGNGEADVFFFGDGTNTNVITGFMAAGNENADTVKVLGDIATANLDGGTIVIGTADGSKAVIDSLATGKIDANTMVNIESNGFNGIAKLGESGKANSFTYDASVGFYGGGSASDKVSVATGFSDNVEVWLDGSHGVAYSSIDVVDFSKGAGNYVLAGDSSKQTIAGGTGNNALWGGTGASADSIKGGTGKNDFFYGYAEGNDTISSSSANDNVNLYNISLSDITDGEITNSGVWLSFSDGSKLTVATTRDIKFTMSDGSSYTAEHSSKSWK